MATAIMEIDDLDHALSNIVKKYQWYVAHHEKENWGCALKFHTVKMDTIFNIFVQCYDLDLITEEVFIDCTKMYLEFNDDLLTVYYDAIKG